METKKSYKIAKTLLKYPVRLLYRVSVIGKENEPDAPFIICANHSSFVDPVLISASLKSCPRWLAKKQLTGNAFMRWVFRVTDSIAINREGLDTVALHTCINHVKDGGVLGIFPQGTRMRCVEPSREQALAGTALIACRSGVKVLPVSIVTKKRKPSVLRKTKIVIGKPIPYDEYMNISDSPSKKDIIEYIFSKVCEPFGES